MFSSRERPAASASTSPGSARACGAAVTVAARRREKLEALVQDLEATGAADAARARTRRDRRSVRAGGVRRPSGTAGRRARQQCGHRGRRARPRHAARGVRSHPRHQSARRMADVLGGGPSVARREPARRDRQHRLDPRASRGGRDGALRGLEGRRRADDRGSRPRVGTLPDPRRMRWRRAISRPTSTRITLRASRVSR